MPAHLAIHKAKRRGALGAWGPCEGTLLFLPGPVLSLNIFPLSPTMALLWCVSPRFCIRHLGDLCLLNPRPAPISTHALSGILETTIFTLPYNCTLVTVSTWAECSSPPLDFGLGSATCFGQQKGQRWQCTRGQPEP